jgi:hypothetical protein
VEASIHSLHRPPLTRDTILEHHGWELVPGVGHGTPRKRCLEEIRRYLQTLIDDTELEWQPVPEGQTFSVPNGKPLRVSKAKKVDKWNPLPEPTPESTNNRIRDYTGQQSELVRTTEEGPVEDNTIGHTIARMNDMRYRRQDLSPEDDALLTRVLKHNATHENGRFEHEPYLTLKDALRASWLGITINPEEVFPTYP